MKNDSRKPTDAPPDSNAPAFPAPSPVAVGTLVNYIWANLAGLAPDQMSDAKVVEVHDGFDGHLLNLELQVDGKPVATIKRIPYVPRERNVGNSWHPKP